MTYALRYAIHLTNVVGLAFLTILLASQTALQAQAPFTIVMPPHSVVAGRTLQEWSALWWKWAYGIPTDDNPVLDLTGDKAKFGDQGSVFFLAGSFGVSPVNRNVTIAPNKFIFFPLQNVVNDNVGNGCTTPILTPCPGRRTIDGLFSQLVNPPPQGYGWQVTALHASIDGRTVPNLFDHRETAPAFSYTYQLTDSIAEKVYNYMGPDAVGTVFPAVADGYYLMLSPLSPGVHTINFGGTTTFGGAPSTLNVTYQVTVTGPPSLQPAVLIP